VHVLEGRVLLKAAMMAMLMTEGLRTGGSGMLWMLRILKLELWTVK